MTQRGAVGGRGHESSARHAAAISAASSYPWSAIWSHAHSSASRGNEPTNRCTSHSSSMTRWSVALITDPASDPQTFRAAIEKTHTPSTCARTSTFVRHGEGTASAGFGRSSIASHGSLSGRGSAAAQSHVGGCLPACRLDTSARSSREQIVSRCLCSCGQRDASAAMVPDCGSAAAACRSRRMFAFEPTHVITRHQ